MYIAMYEIIPNCPFSGYELCTVHTDAVIVYKFLKDLSNGTGGSEN